MKSMFYELYYMWKYLSWISLYLSNCLSIVRQREIKRRKERFRRNMITKRVFTAPRTITAMLSGHRGLCYCGKHIRSIMDFTRIHVIISYVGQRTYVNKRGFDFFLSYSTSVGFSLSLRKREREKLNKKRYEEIPKCSFKLFRMCTLFQKRS